MDSLKNFLHIPDRNVFSSTSEMRQCTLLELSQRSALAICHNNGAQLSCQQGTLWITQLGHSEDIVLCTGESVYIRPCSDVLVRAFHTAVLDAELTEADSKRAPLKLQARFVEQWSTQPDWDKETRLAIEGPFTLRHA
jgi:hypothetical protein